MRRPLTTGICDALVRAHWIELILRLTLRPATFRPEERIEAPVPDIGRPRCKDPCD